MGLIQLIMKMKDNNQQYQTKPNGELDPESDPYMKLDEKMRQAVDMRLENIGLKDIAAKVGAAYATVRWYFMRGGPCYEAYQYMRQLRMEERKHRLKRISKEIEDLAADAMFVLKEVVRNPATPAIVRANSAIKVLEMAGFGGILKTQDVNDSEGIKLLRQLIGHDEQQLKNRRNRKTLQSKR